MLGAFMYAALWTPLQLGRLFLWRWPIEGIENLPPRGQGVILVVNHLNWFDIPVVGLSLPLRHWPWWVAKTEVLANPVISWWLRSMRVIPIRRGKRDMAALDAAEQALKQGGALIIFPEGHRSDTGGLQEGHGGAIRLAVRTGCPILPIGIWGSEVGPRRAIWSNAIHMRIGEPYYVTSPNMRIPWNRMNELTDEMMLRIAELLPEQYWGIYRERMLASRAAAA